MLTGLWVHSRTISGAVYCKGTLVESIKKIYIGFKVGFFFFFLFCFALSFSVSLLSLSLSLSSLSSLSLSLSLFVSLSLSVCPLSVCLSLCLNLYSTNAQQTQNFSLAERTVPGKLGEVIGLIKLLYVYLLKTVIVNLREVGDTQRHIDIETENTEK